MRARGKRNETFIREKPWIRERHACVQICGNMGAFSAILALRLLAGMCLIGRLSLMKPNRKRREPTSDRGRSASPPRP